MRARQEIRRSQSTSARSGPGTCRLTLVETLRGGAERIGASVAQVAIAWVASRGADIVPVIGARRRDRLTESLGAAGLVLSAAELAAIEAAVPKDAAAGERYPAALLAHMDSEKG